ncbi:MAG: magnesium transporter [Flavobacteriales bacterium]|jgi:magnesium transporter|nr:magnesium transporter [Flavobacteriales bacterium]|tara:strand:- start:7910 stop:9259 length:1350 start_codon:yes stop_codon:yes gene_type:complete
MKFELTNEFISELNELINNKDPQSVQSYIKDCHHADIAEILDELEFENACFLFELLEDNIAADVLVELEDDLREELLKIHSPKEIAEEFVDNMDSDDAADIISELPENKKQEVLSHIEDQELASDIADLLNYEEDTAGGLMAKELIKVNSNWSVMRCVKEMRRQAEDVELVYTIYVVDDNNVLLGTLSLKRLLLTDSKTVISDIMKEDIIKVSASMDQEEVANTMNKYDLIVLPVVNDLNQLIGRITADDVMHIMKEEAEKDYQMASGISEDVESSDTVWEITRARLPWLLIGMIGGLFGAKVIGVFDIEKNYQMAFFIPLIAAMGGNVGVQSAAIVVQSLAGGTNSLGNISQRLLKELGVALVNGVICSSIILLAAYFLGYGILLSLTVSIALLSVIIFAALFGTFIPLILDKNKIDPALATGPFITTVNDVLGLFIYFLIGQLILSI